MAHSMKYARIERERRFLLHALPSEIDRAICREIDDLYITGTRLRLRRTFDRLHGTNELKLNQKLDGDRERRIVTSIYITESEYRVLDALPGMRITKRRHRHYADGNEFGIDEFGGALTGLVIAEIEVDSDAARRAITVPAFAHCEITDCSELTGAALARAPPADSLAFAARLLKSPRGR
jgi:CYTH domain-containing protein